MKPTASGRGPQISAEEAEAIDQARQRMIARHGLIEKMIQNNALQLKNEAQRGGTEIERECALRDLAASGFGEAEQILVAQLTERLRALHDEHQRLVAEREWLNTSLLEFESGPSGDGPHKAGHA